MGGAMHSYEGLNEINPSTERAEALAAKVGKWGEKVLVQRVKKVTEGVEALDLTEELTLRDLQLCGKCGAVLLVTAQFPQGSDVTPYSVRDATSPDDAGVPAMINRQLGQISVLEINQGRSQAAKEKLCPAETILIHNPFPRTSRERGTRGILP